MPTNPEARTKDKQRKLRNGRRLTTFTEQEPTTLDRMAGRFKLFVYRVAMTLNAALELPSTPHLDLLYWLIAQVVEGSLPKTLLNLPPKHFKSLIASISLAAYELALRPHSSILIVCHSDRLAVEIATAIRRIVEAGWYKARYPTRIAKDEDRREDFKTTAGGGVRAISIHGGNTGFAADLIIVDDPTDIGDAGSPEKLEKVNDRFDRIIRTRLKNQATGRMVVIQQRLHPHDLSGHLLEEGGWQHLSLPFLAEQDEDFEFLGKRWQRRAGELLWQAAYPPAEVERLRSSPSFASLYQQRPGSSTFGLTADHFPPFDEVPYGSGVLLSIDTASSERTDASFSVIMAFRSHRDREYLVDVWRGQVGYLELLKHAVGMIRRWNASIVLVERSGLGPALASELERRTSVPTECLPPAPMSKLERFRAVLPWIEGRRVLIQRHAPWVASFLEELLAFPSSVFDDQVDTLVQNLLWKNHNQPPPYKAQRAMGVVLTAKDYRPEWHRPDHLYVSTWPRRGRF